VCRRGSEIVAVDARSPIENGRWPPEPRTTRGGSIRLRIPPRLGGTVERRDAGGPASAQEWQSAHMAGFLVGRRPNKELRVSEIQYQAWPVHAAGQGHRTSSRTVRGVAQGLTAILRSMYSKPRPISRAAPLVGNGNRIVRRFPDNNPSSELAFARYIVRQQRFSSSQELLKAKPQDLVPHSDRFLKPPARLSLVQLGT
jgi:hypothetical protein